MVSDLIPDKNTIELWIDSLNRYHQLKELRTNEEVYFIIIEIMTNLSKDLSKSIAKNIDSYLD
jgi:hypothetical protein